MVENKTQPEPPSKPRVIVVQSPYPGSRRYELEYPVAPHNADQKPPQQPRDRRTR